MTSLQRLVATVEDGISTKSHTRDESPHVMSSFHQLLLRHIPIKIRLHPIKIRY